MREGTVLEWSFDKFFDCFEFRHASPVWCDCVLEMHLSSRCTLLQAEKKWKAFPLAAQVRRHLRLHLRRVSNNHQKALRNDPSPNLPYEKHRSSESQQTIQCLTCAMKDEMTLFLCRMGRMAQVGIKTYPSPSVLHSDNIGTRIFTPRNITQPVRNICPHGYNRLHP